MNQHFILQGKQLVAATLLEWARFMEYGNRRVAVDVVDGVKISTVFLGIDHGFGGKPLWFETMIFGGEHDQYQDRYATYEEAEKGHRKAVRMVKGTELRLVK